MLLPENVVINLPFSLSTYSFRLTKIARSITYCAEPAFSCSNENIYFVKQSTAVSSVLYLTVSCFGRRSNYLLLLVLLCCQREVRSRWKLGLFLPSYLWWNEFFPIKGQRYDFAKLALTVSALVNFGTIGNTWRKSPPKTITFPPKGLSMSIISLKLLSTVSIVWRLAIGASFHITNFCLFDQLGSTTLFWHICYGRVICLKGNVKSRMSSMNSWQNWSSYSTRCRWQCYQSPWANICKKRLI